MNLIGSILEKLNISFIWKGNKKKVIKQNGGSLQVCQEQNSITNILQIQNLTVANIEELASIDVPQDSNALLQSAGKRFLAEQKIKQENLKTIVNVAELSNIPDPQQVNQDWFLKWMEISQTVSFNRENVQKMLAKILSGEVKKSESFSLRTLEILRNLSQEEINIFQKFCDISYSIPAIKDSLTCVICEPFGNPGDNGLISLDLSYHNLTLLQDAGLIKSDLNAWIEFMIPQFLQIPFNIGSEPLSLKTTEGIVESKPHVKIINFTTVGLELRSVLNLGSNSEYNLKFLEWVKDKWKMVP